MTVEIRNRQEFEPIIFELNSELKKKYDDFVTFTLEEVLNDLENAEDQKP